MVREEDREEVWEEVREEVCEEVVFVKELVAVEGGEIG